MFRLFSLFLLLPLFAPAQTPFVPDERAYYGLIDRGVLAEGRRADINVIDFNRLSLGLPRLVRDLPTNAKRLLQDSKGFELTIVNGVVTRRMDKATDAYPGRLVRRGHNGTGTVRTAAGTS